MFLRDRWPKDDDKYYIMIIIVILPPLSLSLSLFLSGILDPLWLYICIRSRHVIPLTCLYQGYGVDEF